MVELVSTTVAVVAGNTMAIDAAAWTLQRLAAVLVPASLLTGAGIHAHAAAEARCNLTLPRTTLMSEVDWPRA